jgi:hypothetical protein
MQLPNLFLPNQSRKNYGGFCNPGYGLHNVVVDPVALFKPKAIAVANVGETHPGINQCGYG